MRSIRVCILFAVAILLSAADMTKLTVQVNSVDNGKPVDRAAVIIRFKHGIGVNLKKIQTNWETRTNQEGKVTVPAINRGQVTIQIIAANYQTFGGVYDLTEDNQTIAIKLNRPQSQYSEDEKHSK